MLFYKSSLLTGVEASAAQNLPVTKTCSQCGAVLPSSVRACNFCNSSFSVDLHPWEESSDSAVPASPALSGIPGSASSEHQNQLPVSSTRMEQDGAWRGELSQRIEAYRTRRRRLAPNAAQSQFSFDGPSRTAPHTPIAVEEPPASVEEDFSFTLAIGRPSKKRVAEDPQMLIDVSLPPDSVNALQSQPAEEERRSLPGCIPWHRSTIGASGR